MKYEACTHPFRAKVVVTAAGLMVAALASSLSATPEPRKALIDLDPHVRSLHNQGKGSGPAPRGEPQVICTLSDTDNCQVLEFPRVAGTSFQSVGGPGFPNLVADHFRTSPAGGTVSTICWWGTYGTACGAEPVGTDHFFVRILPRRGPGPDEGAPDASAPIAVFEQGVNLTVTSRNICDVNLRATTEYSATITGGPALNPNTCYFIEISNRNDALTPGTPFGTWFWSHSVPNTDNTCYQSATGAYTNLQQLAGDRAFCVGVILDVFGTPGCLPPLNPPPTNDSCTTPVAITGTGSTAFDNVNASTNPDEGQNNAACNYAGGTTAITRDIWFDWTAAAAGFTVGQTASFTVSTCGSAFIIDSKMAVYNSPGAGICPTETNLIDCIDDVCDQTPVNDANVAATITFNAVIGNHYIIQVGGGAPAAAGSQTLVISAAPANGSCCLSSGACVEVPAARCTTLGGTFGGAGSTCGASYAVTTGSAALEPLTSATTIAFANGDDDYTSIPLGFTFSFYGKEYTTANVGVNGQIAFGGPLYPFANTWPIPTHPVEPNNYLAVAADDF
ncbi:MAG: hypothetical protein H7210_01760, partial [Pyrinomonadaceae bacterium]|nr:hypothetical protein [Phycisphaerales bacterium]